MIPAAEAAVERANTEAFIAADAEVVVLQPREKTTNASGGALWIDLEPRAPQTMRLIPRNSNADSPERETLDGRFVKPGFILMGKFDAAMARGDRFSLGANRYEVVFVQEKRDYQVKGEVVRIGASGA